MPYRGLQPERQQGQVADNLLSQAGFTATWKQYISASAGIPAVGIPSASQYRQQTITALVRFPTLNEQATPGGMVAAGDVVVSTRERLARKDELIWRGETYRIESDPIPELIHGLWVTICKRGTV